MVRSKVSKSKSNLERNSNWKIKGWTILVVLLLYTVWLQVQSRFVSVHVSIYVCHLTTNVFNSFEVFKCELGQAPS